MKETLNLVYLKEKEFYMKRIIKNMKVHFQKVSLMDWKNI